MGKKGTKRKTKWRALPLGEEAGGSGNEEELHDEDQSTTSSVVGQPANNNAFKRQSMYYKVAEKPFRQARRFPYDRFRLKEPLVKLESKTFDEEEYTKITTPRQDVLFKKGYFGRKRESSAEETNNHAGETDEEPMMDQIIITNGFVDERGHYLVNGNSYEIYDPYSNTVTVVVGPPPYTNGVTQPVLAAVSCQPVALQPVDWYPPGSDWPSQGSAWTPSFHGNPPQDPVSPPEGAPNFPPADAQIFNQPAYVVPGFMYRESPVFNGVPLQTNNFIPATESQSLDESGSENKLKKTRRKSTDSKGEEEKAEGTETIEEPCNSIESVESSIIAQEKSEMVAAPPPPKAPPPPQLPSTCDSVTEEGSRIAEIKPVEKQNHSTQTGSLEVIEKTVHLRRENPGKESHSTQTLPEETFQTTKKDWKSEKETVKSLPDVSSPSPSKGEAPANVKSQENQYKECHNSPKRSWDVFPRKIYQQRTNFSEERKLKLENGEGEPRPESSPVRISYAKKAMVGLENGVDRSAKIVNGMGKIVNTKNAQSPIVNGINQVLTTNGTNRGNYTKHASNERYSGYEDKRNVNGNVKNGYVKARYNRGSLGGKTTNDRSNQKYKERKMQLKSFEEVSEKKCEEIISVEESRSHSEKSSTVSELSSPTELSSGQNTPPEKLIVRKMEQEINESFEEKLKQNFTKKKEEEKVEADEEEKKENVKEEEDERKREGEEEEEEEEEKPKAKAPESKKKKNKPKAEGERLKEGAKSGKGKKKKRVNEEAKEKSELENSGEDISFLPSFIRQKPQELLFGGWEGMKEEGRDLISEMGSLFDGDEEILKSLGLNEDRLSFSKLPLHSDLLMMLPAFGWGRPKLKIEDFFAPAYLHNDLFTKRNITNMKSTKPEEFFASVVDSPTVEKGEKKKEGQKNGKKDTPKPTDTEKGEQAKEASISPPKKSVNSTKTGYKSNKNVKSKQVREDEVEEKKTEAETGAEANTESKEVKFGIVDAVNTWLQEQGDSEKVLSLETVPGEGFECLMQEEAEDDGKEKDEGPDSKNGESNPIHASSRSAGEEAAGGGCMRVANVITDGFVHVNKEFSPRKRKGRMYRSSSWDAKLSDGKIIKHFKFLTDSASFCQDLISDVRNGLPTRHEYATEELCDPKQIVSKYYTLSPNALNGRVRTVHESDSENEVFDALEYKFLTKESLASQEAGGRSPGGYVSVTDSGVLSDMEGSEDAANDRHRETPCKLQ